MRKRRKTIVLPCLVLFVVLNLHSSADTIVGGPISSNTIWTRDGSPFVVSQSVVVINGATLAIEPGVEVRLRPNLALLVGEGQLVARGTQDSNIVFTADADLPIVNSNRWGYIRFENASVDAAYDAEGNYTNGCIVEHAIVEYAGATEIEGAINMQGSTPFIGSCIVRKNGNGGIYGDSVSGLNVIDSTIASNTCAGYGSAISLWSGTNILLSGNTISDNTGGSSAVYVSAPQQIMIEGNTICDNAGAGLNCEQGGWYDVLVVSNIVCRNDGRGVSLDRCQSASVLSNDLSQNGQSGVRLINAHNTLVAGNRVVGSADWSGINVTSSDHVTIRGNTICSNRVHQNTSRPYGGGVRVLSSDGPVVTDNVVCHNLGGGVCCGVQYNECVDPVLTGNMISSNSGGRGVGIRLESIGGLLSNNTVCANSNTIYGGGLFIRVEESPVRMVNNVIIGNTANWAGGGIYFSGGSDGQMESENNTILGNHGGDGGGIFLGAIDKVSFVNDHVLTNSADNGGAIYFSGTTAVLLDGVTIQGNSATGLGSVAYIESGSYGIAFSGVTGMPTRILANPGEYWIYNANTFTSYSVLDAPGNVDARNVWWGTTNSAEIEAGIHDFFDNAGKGRVFYGPFCVPSEAGPAPVIDSIQASGTNLVFSFTNANHGGLFVVEKCHDLLSNDWHELVELVVTSATDVSGWVDVDTNPVSFYRLKKLEWQLEW